MAQQKLLGKWSSTSLVTGTMIGSGIFMMPAILATYGGISLIGWIVSTIGAIFLALLFSRLSKLQPGAQGGPYAYTRKALGDFSGFLVAWSYWFGILTASAALAVTFTSYLAVIFPIIKEQIIYSFITSLGIIWILTWYNTLGISNVGKLALVTTILKIAPLLLIGLAGLFFIDFSHFSPFNLSGESNLSAIMIVTALTFFSFLGIETATIPANNIKNPAKTIPFATKWGTLIAAGVYILSSFSVMAIISPAVLGNSTSPFADAAVVIFGNGAQYIVAIGAIISVLGALNNNILLQGQMPQAIARDKLFPQFFARNNKKGIPTTGLIISSLLATTLILMNYSGGLLKVFKFMMLVSTVSTLIPYIFCAIAYLIIVRTKKVKAAKEPNYILISLFALLFSLYALVGSGYDSIIWGLLFLLLGTPVYLLIKRKKSNKHE